MNEDNLKLLYDSMSEDYDMGSYEQFKEDLQDEGNRKRFYDMYSKEYNIGEDYDEFNSIAGFSVQDDESEYPKEVIDRFNSPENKAPNYKDIAQINEEFKKEQERFNPYSKGASIGGTVGNILSQSRKTGEEAKKEQEAQAEPKTNMRGNITQGLGKRMNAYRSAMNAYQGMRQTAATRLDNSPSQGLDERNKWMIGGQQPSMPSTQKEVTQAVTSARERKQVAAAPENLDWEERMSAAQELATAEAMRKESRKNFDDENFEEFYQESLAPQFAKKKEEALSKANKMAKGHEYPSFTNPITAPMANAFRAAVDYERETDPQKVTAEAFASMDSGALPNYVYERMGINTKQEVPEGMVSVPMTEGEKAVMERLISDETNEVAEKLQERMYEEYKAAGAPNSTLEYIASKAVRDNLIGRLTQSMIQLAAGSSGVREQLRQMAEEEYGQTRSWGERVVANAAPFAVDLASGGFALPSMAGNLTKEGLLALASVGLKKGMSKAAIASTGRFLSQRAPVLMVGMDALAGMANFGTLGAQNEAVRQLGRGEFDGLELMKSFADEAPVGGFFALGGALAQATRNAGKVTKALADVGGLGIETAVFAGADGIREAIAEGKDVQDVDWGKTFGEAVGQVIGMKASGALLNPVGTMGALRERYTSSKKYKLDLNEHDLQNLEENGYDLNSIFKGAKSISDMAMSHEETLRRKAEGDELKGKKAVVGETGVTKGETSDDRKVVADPSKLEDLINNPNITSDAKRKIVYLATGRILMPEKVFNTDAEVDGDNMTITRYNMAGDVIGIETMSVKDGEKALKEYKDEGRLNIVRAIEGIAGSPRLYMQEAERQLRMEKNKWDGSISDGEIAERAEKIARMEADKLTNSAAYDVKERTGIDVQEALLKKGKDRTGAEDAAIDLYISNMQGLYHADANRRQIEDADYAGDAVAEGMREGKASMTEQGGDPHSVALALQNATSNMLGLDAEAMQTIDQMLADGTPTRQITSYVESLDPSVQQAAMEFIRAVSAYRGATDTVDGDIEKAVKKERERLTPMAYVQNGGDTPVLTTIMYNGQPVYVKNYVTGAEYIHIVDPETGKLVQIMRGSNAFKLIDEDSAVTTPFDQYMQQYENSMSDILRKEASDRLSHNVDTLVGWQMQPGVIIETAQGQLYVFSNDGQKVQLLPTKANAETGQLEPVSGTPIEMTVDDAVIEQDLYHDNPGGVQPVEEAEQQVAEAEQAQPITVEAAENEAAIIRAQLDDAGLSDVADAIEQGQDISTEGMDEEQAGLVDGYKTALVTLQQVSANAAPVTEAPVEAEEAPVEAENPQIPVDKKTGVKLYELGTPIDEAIADIQADGLDPQEWATLAINEVNEKVKRLKKDVGKGAQTRAELLDSKSAEPKTPYGKSVKALAELQQVADYYNKMLDALKPTEETAPVAETPVEERSKGVLDITTDTPAAPVEETSPAEEPRGMQLVEAAKEMDERKLIDGIKGNEYTLGEKNILLDEYHRRHQKEIDSAYDDMMSRLREEGTTVENANNLLKVMMEDENEHPEDVVLFGKTNALLEYIMEKNGNPVVKEKDVLNNSQYEPSFADENDLTPKENTMETQYEQQFGAAAKDMIRLNRLSQKVQDIENAAANVDDKYNDMLPAAKEALEAQQKLVRERLQKMTDKELENVAKTQSEATPIANEMLQERAKKYHEAGVLDEEELTNLQAYENEQDTVDTEGGLVRNDVAERSLSPGWRGTLHNLGRRIGAKIVPLSREDVGSYGYDPEQTRGFAMGNTIYLNEKFLDDAGEVQSFITGHEITHIIKKANDPRVWDAYVDFVKTAMGDDYAKTFDRIRKLYDDFYDDYNKKHPEKPLTKLTDAQIDEEIASNWAGKNVFRNKEAIKQIIEKAAEAGADPVALTKRILDWIKDVVKRLKKMLKVGEPVNEQLEAAENAKKMVQDMYNVAVAKNNAKKEAVEDADGNVRMSIVEDKDEIERLDKEPKEVGYRNVVMKEDGSMGSPMANKLGRKKVGREKTKPFVQEKFSEEKPKKKAVTIQDILGTNKEEPRFSLRGEIGAANDPDAMANLSVAKDMDKAKHSAKSIWLATGWEKGADGKWRNEIPDIEAKPLDFDNVETIEDIVDAPELFAAYPQLKDYKVQFTKMKNAGSINHEDKLIKLDKDYNTDYSLSDEDQKELNERTMDYIRNGNWRGEGDIVRFKRNWVKKHGTPHIDKEGIKTIAHELQHAVQGIEGFARGGSVSGMAYEYLKELAERDPELSTFAKEFADFMSVNDMMRSGKKAIANWLSRDDMDADAETKANLKKVADSMRDMSDAEFVDYIVKAKQLAKQARKVGESRYDRLAGEIEAKNVEDRLDMTEDERRRNPPSETEDLSRENQIVRFSLLDKEYEEAVKDGDKKKEENLVKEAAKAAMPESKIVDEGGNLLPVYHGTTEQFNVFDRTKGRANMDIQGMFFSPWELDAKGYGENVRKFYLNIKNPAPFKEALAALKKFQGQDGAGVKARELLIEKGYDGVNNDDEEYIAFYPEQIKSADAETYDDNGEVIPLSERFNLDKNDIRFSLAEAEDNQGNPVDKNGKLVLEKVNSIDDITDEDFVNPTRNVELPTLPKVVDDAIGAEGKPTVIKKNIFQRNNEHHGDITPEQSRDILNSALYTPDLYGQNQRISKPYNWVVISVPASGGDNKLVLLEVNRNKDNVEIVHWHYIRESALNSLKKQAQREGGQILILPSSSEEAGGLSSLTPGLSDGKGMTNLANDQINFEKNAGKGRISPEKHAENKAKLSDNGMADDGEEIRFSVHYVPDEDERKEVINRISEEAGVPRKKAKKWLDSETSLAALILSEDYMPYLDYKGDDRYTAIKSDSDYPQGTVDFNNICRKRKDFTKVYQQLQKKYPNTVITGEDLATIRDVMKSNGMDVACGLCYVEDRRQMLGEIAASFINEVKGGFEEYAKGSPTKEANARKFNEMIGDDKKDDLSVYDLITVDGSNKLYEEHRGIYDAFKAYNAARGQQAGNLFQGYAEYKREILGWTKKKVDSVNSNGGLRVFSYSDFEAPHLIDLVQIIQDCARKGVKIQGYTKVPAFARAVAETGIKLNRSLIPLGDTGIEDGKLAYDPVEGIDVNDKDFLPSNDNIGNILIGINDEQIRLAMQDPFIHFIIPYHSNQSGMLREMKGTGKWTNYKNFQTEKGDDVTKHGVNIYTDVLDAAEKDGKPIKNEKQFTEKFLQVCKEKGWTPRFSQFLDKNKKGEFVYTPGYYKLLVDFKLFDENGKILPQYPVKADFDDEFNTQILNDYVKDEKEAEDTTISSVIDELDGKLGLGDRDQVRFSISEEEKAENDKVFDAAKNLFGTTNDINEAGYILPDGSMLDFSGRHELEPGSDSSFLRGRRTTDHRQISAIGYEKDGNTKTGIETSMPDFIERGAIRIDANAGTINLSNKPTKEQKDAIRRVVAKNDGDVIVDFGNGWDTEHEVEYDGASAKKVLSDIDKYYDEGIKPQSDIRFSISDDAPVFYSNARKAVESIQQEKATPEQWLKMIEKQGGLKAGEDKWLGLSDWLKGGDKKSLTKQEVMDFIRENQVRVEEVGYVENHDIDNNPKMIELRKEFNALVDKYKAEKIAVEEEANAFNDEMFEKYGLGWANDPDRMSEEDQQRNDEMIDRWNKLNDEDSKELALQEMTDNYGDDFGMAFTFDAAGNLVPTEDYGYGISDAAGYFLGLTESPINSTRLQYTTDGLDNKREIALVVPTIEPYNENDDIHFGDAGEGRAVAWVRFGETTDADGNRVLVIDEIQSKRHQEGREKGYKENLSYEELQKRYDDAVKEFEDFKETHDLAVSDPNVSKEYFRLQNKVYAARGDLNGVPTPESNSSKIPDAPFDKNWHELAMKRMLRYAAENGYDKVAWTKGEQQAERYSLAKTIPSITRQDTKKAADKGIKVFAMDINGEPEKIFVDNDGTITNTTLFMDEVSGKPLSDFVGKEIAIRMMSMNDGETIDTSKEKVGGEGMKGFYDQMLPRFMDKYGKKWGVKTGEVELPNVEEAGRKMWAVDVTPEMKESVMQGQPMFNIAGSSEDEEAVNNYSAGTPTLSESVMNGMIRLSEENRNDTAKRVAAIRSIGARLSDINKAMRAQKDYDKGTVDSIVRLAKILAANTKGLLSKYEEAKIWNSLARVVGKKDTTEEANNVVDIMLDAELRTLHSTLKKVMNTKGVKLNSSGVESMGGLDIPGQRLVEAFKDGIKSSPEDLSDRIYETLGNLGEDGLSEKAQESLEAELRGLELAQRYQEDVQSVETDIRGILRDIAVARRDPESVGINKGKERADYIRDLKHAATEAKLDLIPVLSDITAALSGEVKAGATRAKMLRDEDMRRKQNIWHDANSDLKGLSNDMGERKETMKDKIADSSILRFLTSPLATFNEMLRYLGGSSPRGEGRLFNRFMPQYTAASDKEYRSMLKNREILDQKLSEVFGKKVEWSDLYRIEKGMGTVPVTVKEGKEEKAYDLTQGNIAYIYASEKQPDGRVKLRNMGISEEDVEALTEKLDPRLREVVDWLQDEFLPAKRKEYNEVHERMFGAPMANIEHYFPIVTNSLGRGQDFDVKTGSLSETKPSTITGSIIKRKWNRTPLDITRADAFDVAYNHLQDMEHWAAFAEFSRDLNTLINYPGFRKKLQNMSSLRYGGGKNIYDTFKKVATIASGEYHPTVSRNSADNAAVNIAKGVTMAKISFRLFTAAKQLLSAPAYLTEASVPNIIKHGTPITWAQDWNWAMENLPGFKKRWMSRQAGDYRLKRDDLDWTIWNSRLIEKLSKWGMSPNALVDAMTVAMGARAIYDTAYNQMVKDGMDPDVAKDRALKKASISVNETQQSSENAYLAPIQVDRTAMSAAFTAFRNASMGYQRRLVRSMADIKNRMDKGYKDRAIEQVMKQAMADGLDEEQARKAAERVYKRAVWRDLADIAVFGYVMQFFWNAAPYLPLLLMGGDDDDKKQALKDISIHSLFGGIEGLTGGNWASNNVNNIINENWYNVLNNTDGRLPIEGDIQNILKDMRTDEYAAVVDVVHLLMQAGIGVNPANISDWVAAIMDAGEGLAGDEGNNLEKSEEIAMLLMRLAEVPKSATDKFYMDKVFGKNPRDIDPDRLEAFLKRYVDYKRNAAEFLIRPLRDLDEKSAEKVDAKWAKRFENERKERMKKVSDSSNGELIEKFEKDILKELKAKGERGRTAEEEKLYKYYNRYERFFNKGAKEYRMDQSHVDNAANVLAGLIEEYIAENDTEE